MAVECFDDEVECREFGMLADVMMYEPKCDEELALDHADWVENLDRYGWNAYELHDHLRDRVFVARHPDASVDLLRALSVDVRAVVRGAVAANPVTPGDVLEVLAVDKSRRVRSCVALNGSTPQHVLARFIVQGSYCAPLSANPSTPAAMLHEFAAAVGEDGLSLRWEVSKNPGVGVDTLELLARDSFSFVRVHVARSPNSTVEVLALLVDDDEELVREEVARSDNASADLLERLAGDVSAATRKQVALHGATPPHVLERLAGDDELIVRWGVAIHRDTPVAALRRLAVDDYDETRVAALTSLAAVDAAVFEDLLAAESDPHVLGEVLYAVGDRLPVWLRELCQLKR